MNRHGLRVLFVLLAFMMIWSVSGQADILYTTSGNTLEGTIVEESETEIIIDIGGGQVPIEKSKIERIERKNFKRKAPAPRPRQKSDKASGGFRDFWSKLQQGTDGPLEGVIPEDLGWLVLVMIALLQYLAASVTAKLYLSISHLGVTFLQTLWFQIKCLLVGMLLGWIGVLIFGFVWGATVGVVSAQDAPTVAILTYSIFVGINAIVFYTLAKKDLDVEFISAVLLGLTMSVTYFIVEVTAEKLGLDYTNFFSQVIESRLAAVGVQL